MELLGRGSLFLALALAAYAAVAGFRGGVTRDRRVVASAERALVACFAATAVAAGVLWWAFLHQDYRFALVARFSSSDLDWPYRLSAFWASQPGSLLLWLLILTGYAALVVRANRGRHRELAPWVTGILGSIAAFFGLALVVAASPFDTLRSVPVEGAGLVPSLQNPYMMAHPPLLYLGYVGFAVPFAFAMAALFAGQTDERWVVAVRRWTIVPWAFLGVGMLLGAHWAYEEIGWGGFWGWDAVENAALIPWLVATGLLHSIIVQEKKGMLKVWNVSLVSLTFGLSILGTFITRSGILSSVHSFVFSGVGWWLLVFLALLTAFATVMILAHLPLLRARHRIESVISREATFLFNNLLFVAFAFAVLWGVLFPLLSRAVRGDEVLVSSPFYDFFATVFGLPILFLAGVGPVIAWRRSSVRSALRPFLWPFAAAFAAAVLLFLRGYGTSVPGVVALSLCLFVAVTVVLEFVRGTRARRALTPGLGWPRAFAQLVARNRRRYGGYIVHLAVVVGVVAIVGTMAYATTVDARLRQGQSVRVGDYTLTYRGSRAVERPSWAGTQALLDVRRGGQAIGTLRPQKGISFPSNEPSNEVAIRPNLRN
ncbi:MAG TPA: cytochrome c-type biogenesis CcmF C-terminal domain-containing protein, partial [Solirubrobacteraceae bacterium]|nr:cytochrome c-type biogenesis CcmF C-terminal domain-containing protein [Solirubrobacteraceae bacterium]